MSRKILTMVFIGLAGSVILSGCRGKADTVAEPSGEVGTKPEEIAAPPESPGGESPEKSEPEPLTVGKTEPDYEQIYAPVIEEVRDVVLNGYDFDKDYTYIADGLMEDSLYDSDALADPVGYLMEDINGDLVPELLIGRNVKSDYEGPEMAAKVYSLYTCRYDLPVPVFDSMTRSCFYRMEDGHFYYEGSGGVMHSIFGECHLGDDGTQVWDDFYFSDEGTDGNLVFYHNDTGIYEAERSELLDISENDFFDIRDRYFYRHKPISWTLFTPGYEYPGGGRNTENNVDAALLSRIEKKLNSVGYYGFLLSRYSDPRDIYWDEVFYVGAGFDKGYPSDEIINELLAETGDDEIYTDITVVTGRDVREYVKATTGYDYSEMNHPLNWVYLKDRDLYLSEHGDTNQIMVEVEAVHFEDGEYIATYNIPDGIRYCVTFKDEGGTYRFSSNLPEWFVHDPTNGGDVDQSTLTDGMLIPDSDSRKLSEEDLKDFDAEELRIARNEIYARHGRKFTDKALQDHFGAMDWYAPVVDAKDFKEDSLSEIEKYNIEFIGKYEKKKKG